VAHSQTSLGAPPQAWGGRENYKPHNEQERSTPTGVGRTAVFVAPAREPPEHPHRRGEDQPSRVRNQ
jgi:hypothetical protein